MNYGTALLVELPVFTAAIIAAFGWLLKSAVKNITDKLVILDTTVKEAHSKFEGLDRRVVRLESIQDLQSVLPREGGRRMSDG